MKLVDTNLKMCDVGTDPFCVDTDEEHIKLHSITLAVAKRGSGRSYFLSNLLEWLNLIEYLWLAPLLKATSHNSSI